MSEFADLLNAPTELEYKGTVYKLRDLTLAERAQVSRRLERRAEEALGRSFGRMPDEAWRAWSAAVAADIAAGTYEWGGEGYIRGLRTVDGMAYTLHLALQGAHPQATEAFCVQMITDLLGERLLKELEKVARVADPGNSSAPGARSARRGKSSKSSATSRSAKRRKKSGK